LILNIAYIEPAERAWARTRKLLFRPVDVERWVVIGFAAFLASLAGQWAGINVTPRWGFGIPPNWDQLISAPFENLLGMIRGSSRFLYGVPVALAVLGLGLAFLWLSSRGKLVFLENMIRERGAIIDPWKRYGRLGNSLFLWRLGLVLATMLVTVVFLWPMFLLGRSLGDSGIGRPIGILAGFGAAFGALIGSVIVAYVALFLESFVVPLMLRHEVTAAEAWRLFVPLLRRRLPELLAYGLVVLLACVAVFLCLIAAAIATCCILPLLLSVPYVRSVLLLPLSGFYRLYSVEFLQQFGPEYRLAAEDLSFVAVPETDLTAPDPATTDDAS